MTKNQKRFHSHAQGHCDEPCKGADCVSNGFHNLPSLIFIVLKGTKPLLIFLVFCNFYNLVKAVVMGISSLRIADVIWGFRFELYWVDLFN